ncbi:30S ribosomal protein S17e [Candidatus Woesearchaeota archaeon]|nr:30S ribosomal protein S17e [Candidatus Woesearchaeota archaeon]
MGRIKTTVIERRTKELFQKYGTHFTPDFMPNKELTNRFVSVSSKKLRNSIAGYITRLKKQEQKGGLVL